MHKIEKQKWSHNKCKCACKELDDWSSYKDKHTWNPSTYGCEGNKACKIDKYLDIKNCSDEKLLIGKLVLECENETLHTTENLLNHKKKHVKKRDHLSHTISHNY